MVLVPPQVILILIITLITIITLIITQDANGSESDDSGQAGDATRNMLLKAAEYLRDKKSKNNLFQWYI